MAAAERSQLHVVCSPAHEVENERNPREDRRLATRLWLAAATVRVANDPDTVERGRVLAGFGFAPLDAFHLAFAERANAQWFATTDDRLLARARSLLDRLTVRVVRPDQIPLPSQGEAG